MEKLDFYNVENRRWAGPRLRNSSIIGHTTTSSTRIWIRCRYEGEYHLILCKTSLTRKELNIGNKTAKEYLARLGEKVVGHKSHYFRNRTDRTHVFDFQSLSPGTLYFYYVFSDVALIDSDTPRMIIGWQDARSFKTISEENNSLTFGLYSCHDPFKKKADTLLWKKFFTVLQERNAEFVLGGGDQIYVDSTETDIWKWLKKIKKDLQKKTVLEISTIMASWYQDVYRGYWGFSDVQRVYWSFPNYMIWDDHEIMDGWGSRTRDELSDELDTWHEWENKKVNLWLADKMFEAAKTVYKQYQHNHNPKTDNGVFDFPLVQKHAEFYFMDMRGLREFDKKRRELRDGGGAKDIILGKQQLARFKDWLKNISPNTKMIYIVSPVPIIHWTGLVVNTGDVLSYKDDLRDEWDHETNHLERDKILNAVFLKSHESGIPFAFLSGDVHMSAAFRLTHRDYWKAKIFQITSSPITRPPAPSISEIILSSKGNLKTHGKENAYRFQRLAKFYCRNFCVLKSEMSKKDNISLYVDFYGESDEQDEIRMKRIKLI